MTASLRAYELSAKVGAMINAVERAITVKPAHPVVMLTSPVCGDVVAAGGNLAIAGLATVFEAALTVELRDQAGTVVFSANLLTEEGGVESRFSTIIAVPSELTADSTTWWASRTASATAVSSTSSRCRSRCDPERSRPEHLGALSASGRGRDGAGAQPHARFGMKGQQNVQEQPGQGGESHRSDRAEVRELCLDVDPGQRRQGPAERPQRAHAEGPQPPPPGAVRQRDGLRRTEHESGDRSH
ncbi:hypothetical protein E3O06_14575 [Cryobacterium glaciale]|uniref:Bacterial spore germination immunoglobulin-like domain-containing protein n=1 Tax=Cryobacterium glaciale TaxID=1259145 RepID=A0A4R8UT37_9MICO|nr:hypothetical protein E3O06_14575 [Cryobacterium glaciale]